MKAIDKEIIDALVEKLIEKAALGPPQEWPEAYVDEVCQAIHKKTGVAVSPATLKRLVGKIATKEDYRPQISTLDIVARYVDYQSFLDFKRSFENEDGQEEETQPNKTVKSAELKYKRLLYVSIGSFVVGIAAIVYTLVFNAGPRSGEPKPNNKASSKTDKVKPRSPKSYIELMASPKKVRTDTVKGDKYEVTLFYDVSQIKLDKGNLIMYGDGNVDFIEGKGRNAIKHTYDLGKTKNAQYGVKILNINDVILAEEDILFYDAKWHGSIRYKNTAEKKQTGNYDLLNMKAPSDVDTNEVYKIKMEIYNDFLINHHNFKLDVMLFNRVFRSPKNIFGDIILRLHFEKAHYLLRFKTPLRDFKYPQTISVNKYHIDKNNPDRKRFIYDPDKDFELSMGNKYGDFSITLNGKKIFAMEEKERGGQLLDIGFEIRGFPEFKIIRISDNNKTRVYDLLEEKYR